MKIRGIIIENGCSIKSLLKFLMKQDENSIVKGFVNDDYNFGIAIENGAYIIFEEINDIDNPELW